MSEYEKGVRRMSDVLYALRWLVFRYQTWHAIMYARLLVLLERIDQVLYPIIWAGGRRGRSVGLSETGNEPKRPGPDE